MIEIYTRDMVSVYIDGEKVAAHCRYRRPGGYTTDKKHMPSYYDDYVMASSKRYKERGYKASSLLGTIIEHIFDAHKNIVPELYYKGCEGSWQELSRHCARTAGLHVRQQGQLLQYAEAE